MCFALQLRTHRTLHAGIWRLDSSVRLLLKQVKPSQRKSSSSVNLPFSHIQMLCSVPIAGRSKCLRNHPSSQNALWTFDHIQPKYPILDIKSPHFQDCLSMSNLFTLSKPVFPFPGSVSLFFSKHELILFRLGVRANQEPDQVKSHPKN